MRDLVYFAHLLLGMALVALPFVIRSLLENKSALAKPVSIATAALSWIMLLPSGILYTVFYPATKTVVKAGSWPWAHSIVMETKEHWGLLLPVIVTLAAILVLQNKGKESRKWWLLAAVLALLIGVLGRIVKMGAGA